MPTPHNSAKKGDFARTVLMPGHHADRNALVGACVALHAADVVDELWFI